MGFWNICTISLGFLAVIIPVGLYLINDFNKEYLNNAIMLFTVFVTILSTLYSNYKSDLRILLNNRQNAYHSLYSKLNKFFPKLINQIEDINYKDFCEIFAIIKSFKNSYEFIYCSYEIKDIINEFINETSTIKFDPKFKGKESLVYNANKEKFNELNKKILYIHKYLENELNFDD